MPSYEACSALNRETWRPGIRAAVLAAQRIGLHRKLMKTAAADLYPVVIGTDALVYPSLGPSLLDVLPHTPENMPVPGMFRLGVSPGMVEHQGTQTVLRAHRSAPASSFSGAANNSGSRLTADSLLATHPCDQLRLLH